MTTAPDDTAHQCRVRAAQDDAAASTALLPNERLRLERSAIAWRLRADMLDRRGKGHPAARASTDIA